VTELKMPDQRYQLSGALVGASAEGSKLGTGHQNRSWAAIWFLGFLATIKANAESTGGRVAVIQHFGPQDSGSPLHVHHRENEWFYVLEGELTIWVDGQGPPAFIGPRPREYPHSHVADTTVMMCWSELFSAAFTRLRSKVRVL
jgi:mannose-6-phosphate isomerase-like protein (cupin superfamily)